MVLTGLLIVLILLLRLAPDSPLARMLNRVLVIWPLDQVLRLTLRQAIFGGIMIGFALAGPEAIFLAGPELVATYAFELSIYLDAVLVTYALAVISTARAGVGRARDLMTRIMRLPQARRRKRTRLRPPNATANDDEAGPPYRMAA
jgi:hypothetical protein